MTMRLSLKTKFYFYVLPLMAVLPLVLYFLITPYTQLREGFTEFKSDAGRAQEAEGLAEDLNTEQLELFHLLGAAPAGSYDITTNSNYADFESAVAATADQLKTIQSEVTESVGSNDEEKVALDNITEYSADFETLAGQVLVLSSEGKKEEALALLGERIDGLVGEYLRPEIEKLELIKEDDVKTSLPALTSTLTSHGVIPIPGLQEQIDHVIVHFENSVDTQKIGKLVDDLQAEVFYQVAKEGSASHSAADDVNSDAQASEIEDQISTTIAHLREGLSEKDDMSQLALIAQVEEAYQKLVILNDQAVSLGKSGHSVEALSLLRGDIDAFAEGTLDPLTKQLIALDKQDVQDLISALNSRLIIITYWLYGLGAALFLAGLGGLWKLSKDIIAPIIKLRDATVRLAAGDFSAQVRVDSKDEIGELAGAFNLMASRLRDSYKDLEGKVREQTTRLSTQVEELESTKKATINLLEDLNKEKQTVEQERAKDEAILGSIGDAVFAIDTEGTIILFNPIAEALSGFTVKEAVGKRYNDVLRFIFADTEAVNDTFITTALSGKKTQMANHTVLISKKGDKVPVADSAAPVYDAAGKVTGAVVVFRDVTHEQQIDKAKTEFVSLASHQLRTPLSAIAWFAELLLDGDMGKISPKQKESLLQIAESNKRMIELVNSLLNVSRIDMGTMASDPKDTDMSALVGSVVGEMKPNIAAKNLKVSVKYDTSAPKIFRADPQLMRIVLQNLISNAIKYTPERGSVAVSVSADKKALHISVADTGYGIPLAAQPKIFTKLYRADNAREIDADGNGLGLYLVKSVIEENGGAVRFESKEGKGTTFYIDLPISGMKKIEGSKSLS